MQILLFILKVIGIILLVLLGLIVLMLTLVLFVPIRYEVSGEIEDEHKMRAGGVIRYLFSIVKVAVAYRNGELETDIYLFGFRKKKKVLEESEAIYTDEVEKEVEKDTETRNVSIENENPVSIEDTLVKQQQPEQLEKQPDVVEKKHTKQTADSVNRAAKPQKEKKQKTKTAKKSKNEEHKFPVDLIKRELTDEHNYNVLRKGFREIKYLFSHFKFRKIRTDLHFGTGDPASTGQILGILAMFPILYRYEFGIIPDFETENAYIKGTFAVAGRIRLVHVLITACRLIFDKEIRMVVKKFMNMRNQ